jgi:uncharacterized membrane protein
MPFDRVRNSARALNAFNLNAGRRLLCAGVVSVPAFVLLPSTANAPTRFLVAWVLGASTFLLLSYMLVSNASEGMTERTASAQDQSSRLFLGTGLIAAAASLVALFLLLQDDYRLTPRQHLAHVFLAGAAVFCSWLVLHVSFAFHYAHRYYGDIVAPFGTIDRGLNFPGKDRPDYIDFAYFSFVIGMTSQVSDVQVTTHRMRRLVLLHGIASFGFYTVILALVINIIGTGRFAAP